MEGYIKIHRKIEESKIWNKPSDWLKIWLYILMEVNFKDNGLPTGSKRFKYEWIEENCNVSKHTIENFIKFAKYEGMLTTQKTTRGMIVNVCMYSYYQTSENEQKATPKTTQKPHSNHTEATLYNKNERMKEGKIIIDKSIINDKSLIEIEHKEDKRILEIDLILGIIQEKHGTIDGNKKEQRQYGKLLKDKLDKIKGFNGDYGGFITYLIDNTDEYTIGLTTSPKSIYYNLAKLITKIKTKINTTKSKNINYT